MHPEILTLGPIAIRAWGLAMAISVLVGVFIALKRAKTIGVDPNILYDLVIVVVVSSIIGSRIFYVIFHLNEFRGNWIETISPFHGSGGFGIAGLSMMGGVAFVIIAVALYCYFKKLSFAKVADVLAPTFLLGEGITRIGCFLNGCCFGRPSKIFAIHFPDGAASDYFAQFISQHPESGATGLIPTQLIASALGFTLFFLVLFLDKKRSYNGYTTWLVLALYSLDRFFVDQFRFYEPEQVIARIGVIQFSVNEIVLLLLLALSAYMFVTGVKKSKKIKR
jgi:phosphatidylglycerol---prolipoprotein diacylglyceryl transferase